MKDNSIDLGRNFNVHLTTLNEAAREFYERLLQKPLNAEIHKQTISANTAPSCVVVRVCTLNECLIDEVLSTKQGAEDRGYAHAERANEALARGEVVWCYFYDGDSGECMNTIITKPSVEASSQKRGN